jgi:hypothetical protein
MIELVANIVITVSAALLFAYWCRAACLLIWSEKAALDYGSAKRRPPVTEPGKASSGPSQEPALSKNFH